jgi:pyridoxal phosphate enzyme (YggS family)
VIPPEQVAANAAAVRARIAAACDRAGRDPASVTLIAVTKTHPPEAVAAAYAAGVRDFGENRVQEAAAKIPAARALGVQAAWHLIGNLQRNKAAVARRMFDVIHSIDSLPLAETLSLRATEPVRVLVEVNVAGEATKHGVSPEDAPGLCAAVARLTHLDLIGLMTVAPIVAAPEDARPVFRRLRELRDALALRELSMGMTGDYEVAIEEGATFIRVGRAIFGART